jgi:hypothetical protein
MTSSDRTFDSEAEARAHLLDDLPVDVRIVAEQLRLGRLQDTFTTEWFLSFKSLRPKVRLFAFDEGVVSHQVDQASEVFRWDQLATVNQEVVSHFRNGRYQKTTFKYALIRTDGARLDFKGSYKDPSHARWADPNDWELLRDAGRVSGT